MILPLALDELHVYIYTHSEASRQVKKRGLHENDIRAYHRITNTHTQRVYYCFVFCSFLRMYISCVLNAHCRRFCRRSDYINVYTARKNCVYILIIIVASGAIRSKSLVMVCVISGNRWEIRESHRKYCTKWNVIRDLVYFLFCELLANGKGFIKILCLAFYFGKCVEMLDWDSLWSNGDEKLETSTKQRSLNLVQFDSIHSKIQTFFFVFGQFKVNNINIPDKIHSQEL